jgi:N-acetylmuramoyl-L-alanine amidase
MPAARRDSANARRTTRTSCRAGRWLTVLASGVTCAAALGACGASGTTTTVTSVQGAAGTPPVAVTQASSANASAAQTTAASALHSADVSPSPTATTAPAQPAASSGPLTGKIVGVDPGHNGGNFNDPSYIDQMIWNGREMEHCNTTGTETDSGYTEAQYNWNVASYLRADLQADGARVVMTRHSNTGVGPCVNVRAHIIDASGADVAIDIHADGGPPDGRGFAILEPVTDGINNRIIGASERFGQILLHDFQPVTGMPTSTYDGTGGIVFRDDLAGLNLTTVPEVLIETGNMRNATDAAMLMTPAWQRLAARAIARAITTYLTGR